MDDLVDYEKRVVRVSDFLPGGMMLEEDGQVRSLVDADFHAIFEGEPVQVLYTMPIRPTYVHCQRCGCDTYEDGFIAVFEDFFLMPCWECNTLVILRRGAAEEKLPKWEDGMV